MNLEETPALVAGQSVEKSGSKSLQKKQSRSASAGTSRVATTSTSLTMMGSNGHPTESVDNDERVGMDLEASVAGQSMEKSTAAEQSMESQGIILSKRKHQDHHQVQGLQGQVQQR
jgi:hypothetical protein